MHWYELAAAQGMAKAQWALSELLAQQDTGDGVQNALALQWCRKAAQSGYGPAQATLGTLLAQSGKFDRAIAWWQKAADLDDPEAQVNLANALRAGQGVAVDKPRAFVLLVRAAEAGIPVAQSLVGLCYVTGDGVAVDPIEGCKWFLLAAEQGDAPAAANVERARGMLSPAQLDEAARRAQAWLLARPKKA